MKLVYLGNMKHLSNEEINDLLNNPDLNGTSKAELLAELRSRTKWQQ